MSLRIDAEWLDGSVREWYGREFPTDDIIRYMDDKSTFRDVLSALCNKKDVYSVIGVGDSVVRERIFSEIAKKSGIKYEFLYGMWLAGV